MAVEVIAALPDAVAEAVAAMEPRLEGDDKALTVADDVEGPLVVADEDGITVALEDEDDDEEELSVAPCRFRDKRIDSDGAMKRKKRKCSGKHILLVRVCAV